MSVAKSGDHRELVIAELGLDSDPRDCVVFHEPPEPARWWHGRARHLGRQRPGELGRLLART